MTLHIGQIISNSFKWDVGPSCTKPQATALYLLKGRGSQTFFGRDLLKIYFTFEDRLL